MSFKVGKLGVVGLGLMSLFAGELLAQNFGEQIELGHSSRGIPVRSGKEYRFPVQALVPGCSKNIDGRDSVDLIFEAKAREYTQTVTLACIGHALVQVQTVDGSGDSFVGHVDTVVQAFKRTASVTFRVDVVVDTNSPEPIP